MATFRELEAYVVHDGWVEAPNLARGKRRTGDHRRYHKEFPDGTTLRTKVSHALGDEIGIDLFKHILRDQLKVDEARFWAVVRRQIEQAQDASPPETSTVPGWLVQRLTFTAGIPEADARRLTPDQAIERWEAFISRPTADDEPS
jgi:hypothetical protein